MENIGLNKSILLNSKFAIHGTSSLGKQCYEWLKDNGLSKNIVCFSDNNKQKQGTEIYSIPIISLDEIKDDSINIIISTMFIKEVYRDIKMLGLHNAVFCYIDLECPYGEEKFDDDRSLLSLYDDDLRTNQLIDDFYKFRTSNVFRLYPIDDAIDRKSVV